MCSHFTFYTLLQVLKRKYSLTFKETGGGFFLLGFFWLFFVIYNINTLTLSYNRPGGILSWHAWRKCSTPCGRIKVRKTEWWPEFQHFGSIFTLPFALSGHLTSCTKKKKKKATTMKLGVPIKRFIPSSTRMLKTLLPLPSCSPEL